VQCRTSLWYLVRDSFLVIVFAVSLASIFDQIAWKTVADILLDSGKAALETQLFAIVFLAGVCKGCFDLARRRGRYFLDGHPWYQKIISDNFPAVSPYEGSDFFCSLIAMGVQHTIGAVLCVPALFCNGMPSVGSRLVVCAGVLEVAWEVFDMAELYYARYFSPGGDAGKRQVPVRRLVFQGLHHSMATCMVVPMNHVYHQEPNYACLVFLLQISGGSWLFLIAYGMTLDISRGSDLVRMQVSSLAIVLVLVLARGPLMYFVVYKLLALFNRDHAYGFLAFGIVGALGMCLFSYLIFWDAMKRLYKFWNWKHQLQTSKSDEFLEVPDAQSLGICATGTVEIDCVTCD